MQRIFHFILEIGGWLLILASPILAAAGISLAVYLQYPSNSSLILGSVVTLIGIISGIAWANKIYRKKGTMWFLSQTMATPDIEDQYLKARNKKE